MKKITWTQMTDALWKHNEENNITCKGTDNNTIYGVVVYKASNWKEEYSLESRSYKVSSDNKAFIPGQLGNSIFASNLDGTDNYIRLDWYHCGWEVDYCYMLDEEE